MVMTCGESNTDQNAREMRTFLCHQTPHPIMASDHFSTQSTQYAAYRPVYPPCWFDWLAEQVHQRHTAWDCACGSGQATQDLARKFRHVIATDLSAAQLSHAPSLPNVEWRTAHAEESGLESESVDLLTVAQALHWFDLPRFWQEARRVLRPGGVIAVWSYGVFQLDHPEIANVCYDFYQNIVGPFWPPERRIIEAGYGSLEFPFLEIPAPIIEMQATWTLDALLGYLRSWSATTRYISTVQEDPLIPLKERLLAVWPPAPALNVRWPLSIRVGRSQCPP